MAQINIQAKIREWQSNSIARNIALKKLDEIKQASNLQEAKNRQILAISNALNNVPARYQRKTWEDFTFDHSNQEKIKKIVFRYAETFKNRLAEGANLIFSGTTGTGKTLLSLILHQHLIQNGFKSHYEPSLDFLRIIQEKKFSSSGAFMQALGYYQEIQLLVIDEATVGSGKDGTLACWEKELLFKIIDTRYRHQYCTLIISNLNANGIRARLTEPTLDRFSDKGITLAFNWPSYRK